MSDYDFADSTQVQQLRDALDILKQSALEQEDLPFDPSGTSGLGTANNDVDGIVSDRSTSRNDTVQSQETDITSYASEFSSLSLLDNDMSNSRSESAGSAGYIIGADGNVTLAGASLEDKTGYLVEMFPSVDRFTIDHTLNKSDGDVDRSMDILLNLAFFDEQPPDEDGGKVSVPKGVDGFEDSTNSARGKGRKRKTKNKKNRPPPFDESALYAAQNDNHTTNKWDAGQKDVEFIHSRTSPILKKETVTSAYHASGASLPATIRALATAHAPKDEQKIHDDPVMATQIAELTQEFPSITPITFAGLLHITRNSTSAANELAAALVTRPLAPSVSQLIQFTATPLKLEDNDEDDKSTRSRRAAAEPRVIRDFDRAQGSAGVHFVAGAEAFSKASVAYRRGRSDRLMGGAAAYYSAVGRDHLERAKRNAAAASDALVDAQSTSSMLDLHGVSVQDAVRIAGERVPDWWESLGDSKYMRGKTGGPSTYRIVTGVGRHSHDGTSRLGPAVFKRLVRDGWRVEVGEGVFTVTGVARR